MRVPFFLQTGRDSASGGYWSRADRMNTSALSEVTHELSAATLFIRARACPHGNNTRLKRTSALICKMPEGEKS